MSGRDPRDGAGSLRVKELLAGCGEMAVEESLEDRHDLSLPGSAAGLFCEMSCRLRGRISFNNMDEDVSKY